MNSTDVEKTNVYNKNNLMFCLIPNPDKENVGNSQFHHVLPRFRLLLLFSGTILLCNHEYENDVSKIRIKMYCNYQRTYRNTMV